MSGPSEYVFDSVEDSIKAIKAGELVVVMDDEDRENEGDLIMAAEFATKEQVALMVRYTTGILCVSITPERAEKLKLPLMVDNNTDPKKTAFTVSCDKTDVSTGVSATDRVMTIHALASDQSVASNFNRPGHIFPLIARPNGVLERRGHTEATVDFCKLAGVQHVGLLAELTNDDGTMSRLPECYAFAKAHNLRVTTVDALVKYRQRTEAVKVEVAAECIVPIQRNGAYLGHWNMRCYKSDDGHDEHIALIKGDVSAATEPVLVRLHSECFTGHVIGSMRCDCNEQMDLALSLINERGCGVFLYIDGHEGRGIGLHNKLRAYSLQVQSGLDTYQANESLGLPIDSRNYETPKQILKHLNISQVALITNNPLKVEALGDLAVSVVPLVCAPNEHNHNYLTTKRAFESSRTPNASPQVPRLATVPVTTTAEASAVLQIPHKEDVARLRIGVVLTSWNESLVSAFSRSCINALVESGVKENNIVIAGPVPGSFELPFAAQALAVSGKVDAVMCFGVIIKGETSHHKSLGSAVSQGLMQVQLSSNIPMINGVLTCDSHTRALSTNNSVLVASLAGTAIRMASFKRGLQTSAMSPRLVQPCTRS